MFYPCEDWIPLRDAVSTIDLKLAPIFRKRLEGEDKVSSREVEQHMCAAAWSVCDNCQTAILTTAGSIVLLSKSLFTRDTNTSRYGDFLKLDIGQLGSQDWPLWSGLVEQSLNEDPLSEEELERLLYPFYRHHVLVNKGDFEKQLGKLMKENSLGKASAGLMGAPPRGRPSIILEAAEIYKKLYPSGHDGFTVAEAINKIESEGGPTISSRSFGRMVKAITEGKNTGQN